MAPGQLDFDYVYQIQRAQISARGTIIFLCSLCALLAVALAFVCVLCEFVSDLVRIALGYELIVVTFTATDTCHGTHTALYIQHY